MSWMTRSDLGPWYELRDQERYEEPARNEEPAMMTSASTAAAAPYLIVFRLTDILFDRHAIGGEIMLGF